MSDLFYSMPSTTRPIDGIRLSSLCILTLGRNECVNNYEFKQHKSNQIMQKGFEFM